MKTAILDALEARYDAQIAEADATIKIYLENSVGIGEHPQHILVFFHIVNTTRRHCRYYIIMSNLN